MKKMDSKKTINLISEKTGLSKSDVERVFQVLSDIISDVLNGEYDEVVLPKLGKIKSVVKKARVARNPKTGDKVNVPPKKAVIIKLRKPISVKPIK